MISTKLDDAWKKFTGPIDEQDVGRIIRADIPEVERLNQIFGPVSVRGPMSPVMGCLPSAPNHHAEGFPHCFPIDLAEGPTSLRSRTMH